MSTKKRPFSPVDEFIKTFNEMSARYSTCAICKHYNLSFTAPYIPIAKTRGFTAQSDKYFALDEKALENTYQQKKE